MLPTATRQFKTVPPPEIIMSHQPSESKRLLSHTIAEWACALKYEHLSHKLTTEEKVESRN
jgi:hypothetical protein